MSLLHLIDVNGNIKEVEDISQYLVHTVGDSEQAFHEKGVDYHVVCIFGGQSSGKSTLLNNLFGTPFCLLDASVRRGQTTQGGFLSRAETVSADNSACSTAAAKKDDALLLVIDLEGTDGLERGDNQSFERQLSLFGLSVADVLIINMWAVDVGRHNAANLSLLRTIFEMNLRLFHHEGYKKDEKPTLLIVLRDFVDDNPGPTLETLKKSFQVVWDGIKKPEAFSGASLEDLFHWKCFFLPHFNLQKSLFDEKVNCLRTWFTATTSDHYLFPHSRMFRGVPLEMLPSYFCNCWDTIRCSKELDIPTQREMLAKHRCGEVSEQMLREFEESKEQLCAQIRDGDVILNFTERVNSLTEDAENNFYSLTELYSDQVTHAFGTQLNQKLVESAIQAVDLYSLRVMAEVVGGLESRIHSAMDTAIQRIVASGIEAELMTPSSALTPSAVEGEITSTKTEGGIADTRNPSAVNNTRYQMAVLEFWGFIAETLQDIFFQISAAQPPSQVIFNRFLQLVEEDEAVRLSISSAVAKELINRLQHRSASMAANASDTLHRYFERALTHRPDGQIRLLRSTALLEKLVPHAKQGVLFLLGALLYFRIEGHLTTVPSPDDKRATLSQYIESRKFVIAVRGNDEEKKFFLRGTTVYEPPVYPSGCRMVSETGLPSSDAKSGVCQEAVLLTASMVTHAYQQFNERADTTVHSKMMMIEAGRLNIPLWGYVVVLLLSLNEIMYVLSSPSLLLLLVLVLLLFGRKFAATWWDEFQEMAPPGVVSSARLFLAFMGNVCSPLKEAFNGDQGNNNRPRRGKSAASTVEKKLKED